MTSSSDRSPESPTGAGALLCPEAPALVAPRMPAPARRCPGALGRPHQPRASLPRAPSPPIRPNGCDPAAEGGLEEVFFFQGWVSGGAADPAVASVLAGFQTSPSRCYAGGTAVGWLPDLGSGSPACRAWSLAFGSADSPPWLFTGAASGPSKVWGCCSCRASTRIAAFGNRRVLSGALL